jgi:hypothetical protein
MHPAIPSPRLTADARLAGWLLVAIAAHALLLLVPSRPDPQSGGSLPNLAVSLLRPPPLQATPALPPPELPTDPVREQLPGSPAPQRTANPPAPPEPTAEPPRPSAAYLLDLAGRREWRLPEPAATRSLGEFFPTPPPSNWQTGRALEPNRFDGMVAPAEVEVVDRWLAADGSHNVVITAPDGETYCGRAEAWNPMNPMLEHIMMWRPCGGGGARTFDMPHPYRSETSKSNRR